MAKPEFYYSPWRHGGWYVNNVRYPSGACGCVSRNYPDGKWRIACDEREGDHTYPSRDAAAAAERDLIAAMPLFSVDVMIYATAYIRARTPEEALKHAKRMKDQSPRIEGWGGALRAGGLSGGVPISGHKYDDPRLPLISLSPAMTIHGPDDDAIVGLAGE